MQGGIWGDRKRGRKGRLVEEWRNIISPRSRRGFVLHRLPSAPVPLHLPPLSFFLENLCYTELSIVALGTRYASCAVLSWAHSHLVSETVQTVTAFFFFSSASFALWCFLLSLKWLCRGHRAFLVCSECRHLLTGCV